MAEEYINIMEAARRCQVSDKTIRRAIKAGKLQVHRPKSNVVLIAVSDLEAWRQLSVGLEQRLTALEQRLQDIETSLGMLAPMPELYEKRLQLQSGYIDKRLEIMGDYVDKRLKLTEDRLTGLVDQIEREEHRRAPSPAPPATTTPGAGQPEIPPGSVRLYDFADQHGISRNEAERLWKTGFISAKKIQEKRRGPGELLLEAKGQHDFWIQFHNHASFQACDHCPHS